MYLGCEQINADQCQIGLGLFWFLHKVHYLAFPVKLGYTEKARVEHLFEKYQCFRRVALEFLNKAFYATFDEVIAEEHKECGFAQKGLRRFDSMGQAQGVILRYRSYPAFPAGT